MELQTVILYREHKIYKYFEGMKKSVTYVVHANGQANIFTDVRAAKSFIDGLEED